MDLHTVSFDTGIGMHTYCAECGYGDLSCGVDWDSNVIEAELPHLHGLTTLRGITYFLFHPGFVWACLGQLQWPRQNSSKVSLSPCHGHLCELSLGHQAQDPIYDFRTNHDWDCLGIGCGWDDQEQHILIIVFDAGIWRLTSIKPRYGMATLPVPSSSNNWPNGWIVVQDLCKTGRSHWIPEHPNQLGQSFPAWLLSLGPH